MIFVFVLVSFVSSIFCSQEYDVITRVIGARDYYCNAINQEVDSPTYLEFPGDEPVVLCMRELSESFNKEDVVELLKKRSDLKYELSQSFEKTYDRVLQAPGEYLKKTLYYAAGALGCFGLLKYKQESLTFVEWWGCVGFGAYSATNFLINGANSWLSWRCQKKPSFEQGNPVYVKDYAERIRNSLDMHNLRD